MITNAYLLVFALAFMGCVLITPLVTRIAAWAGAIDRPDQFRRIHKGATPRLGGLALAFGMVSSVVAVATTWHWGDAWPDAPNFWGRQWSVLIAVGLVLTMGAVDDSRGLGPRVKLLCQALAVLVLYQGGIRIDRFVLLGRSLNFCPSMLAVHALGHTIHPVSLLITLVWFLGCMNVWNLIDGMDGLASGMGLLVSSTLMLVAIYQANVGSALVAAALAGSLVGFLLYNWHPAVIFLGDSGSLTIGLMIGVIGIQDSLKGASALSILFPMLAMGVPISDTAMAIFRRWVRNLPLTAADRRHLHHLLIGLGLNPKQAAVLLYTFTGFLCGVVLLGVAWNSDVLALVLGTSGCLAFLIILYSRRDELSQLRAEFVARLARGRQERLAAQVTWEAIQRIELCEDPERIWGIVRETTAALGFDGVRLACYRAGRAVFRQNQPHWEGGGDEVTLSGPTVSFRLNTGQDLSLAVALHQAPGPELAADIAFRFVRRLALATAERLERLLADRVAIEEMADLATAGSARDPLGWLRWALGWDA
jgi:UDP-GlcNAc:undecaprenyl-phosphate GlcNAc-1-phosphate transferase